MQSKTHELDLSRAATEHVAAHIDAMAACGAPYRLAGQGIYQPLIDIDWDAYDRARITAVAAGITTRDIFNALGGEA